MKAYIREDASESCSNAVWCQLDDGRWLAIDLHGEFVMLELDSLIFDPFDEQAWEREGWVRV